MDRACIDCQARVYKGPRCKKCSALARWRNRGPDYTPPRCKTCAEEITTRSRARAIYCSRKCKFADPDLLAKIGSKPNQVTKTCPGCGKDFSVSVSMSGRFNYCSRACSRDARGHDVTCGRCGAGFRMGARFRAYCSEACRRPPVAIDCGHCGTSFRIVPSSAARKRYCSIRCYRASDAETSIERRVREVLESLGYAHRSQVQIGPWVADFMVGDLLVIEADGSYWHSLRPEVDRRKTDDITGRGYTVWRLPEVEINDAGFPDALKGRLIDYEVTHGQIARVAPGEPSTPSDQHRVIPRQAKRSAVRAPYPGQLLLDFGDGDS